jgi:hypothetical protein
MADERTRDAAEAAGLDAARIELDRAAEDLEQVTALLADRTDRVDWLEALVDELLGLLDVPAVVVDGDGCVLALSQGAEKQVADHAAALGRPVAKVLPRPLADALTLVVALPGGSNLMVADK